MPGARQIELWDLAGEIFPNKPTGAKSTKKERITMTPRKPMRRLRTTRISDVVTFRICTQSYEWSRRRPQPPSEFEVIGNVTHALAAGGNSEEVLQYAERQLEEVAPKERPAIQAKIIELVKTNERMIDDEVTEDNQELQLVWEDLDENLPEWLRSQVRTPATGIKIYAKPDELFFFEDAINQQVMQITDIKTGYRVQRRHKDELFLFGLIASLAKEYYQSIRLVVRMLGSQTEEVFWYSPKLTARCLDELRDTIRQMMAVREEGLFEARTGGHCRGCKFASICPENQEWLEKHGRLPASTPRLSAVATEVSDAPEDRLELRSA